MRLVYIDKKPYDVEILEKAKLFSSLNIHELKTLIMLVNDACSTNQISFNTLIYVMRKYGIHPKAREFINHEIRRLQKDIIVDDKTKRMLK